MNKFEVDYIKRAMDDLGSYSIELDDKREEIHRCIIFREVVCPSSDRTKRVLTYEYKIKGLGVTQIIYDPRLLDKSVSFTEIKEKLTNKAEKILEKTAPYLHKNNQ